MTTAPTAVRLLPSRAQCQLWILLGTAFLGQILLLWTGKEASLFPKVAWGSLAVAAAMMVIDAMAARQMPSLIIRRQVNHALAINKWSPVTLEIHHNLDQTSTLQLFDDVPAALATDQLPALVRLLPGQTCQLVYQVKPLARGAVQLNCCHCRQTSPWGLWLRQSAYSVIDEIKVYPDYSVIAAYNLLLGDQQTNQLGIKRRQRRGEGADFHQLRDYRAGDAMRNIDWKASSRHSRLIAKEYQDERDQRVLILLDSGQRMRAKDGELSHFDQALNAILLVSYIALRQGDSVAVHSFGENPRWLPPQKGADKIKTILNNFYDLQPSLAPGDYLAAANSLCTLQQKRSLVIVVTNTRDEDASELCLAIKQLQRHHLVLLADVNETALHHQVLQPVHTLDEALLFASISLFEQSHFQLHQHLKAAGIFALNTLPDTLAAKMANHYLAIKRAGVL